MRGEVHPIGRPIVYAVVLPCALLGSAVTIWALAGASELPLDGAGYAPWLAAIPAAGGLLIWSVVRRRRGVQQFGGELAPALTATLDCGRSALRGGLNVLAILLTALALLGPRWGRGTERLTGFGVDIVVALDVSRSMWAQDVAPDRLTRAKREIERLTLNPSNRLGLLAFAGSASMKVPLTLDQAFFRSALEKLDPSSAPRGGTAIAEAIYAAGDFFAASPEGATRVILVFTDGEDHEGDPVRAAQEVHEEYGAIVYAVGVGDPNLAAGAQVPVEAGGKEPLVHEGQIVFSKLNMTALAQVAEAGGGEAVEVAAFRTVVERVEGLEKGKLVDEERLRYTPRYQLFLALGLGALTVQTLLAERPRRRRDVLVRITG